MHVTHTCGGNAFKRAMANTNNVQEHALTNPCENILFAGVLRRMLTVDRNLKETFKAMMNVEAHTATVVETYAG